MQETGYGSPFEGYTLLHDESTYPVIGVMRKSIDTIIIRFMAEDREQVGEWVDYQRAAEIMGVGWKTVWKWANEDNFFDVYKPERGACNSKGFVRLAQVNKIGHINKISKVINSLGISKRTLYDWDTRDYPPYDQFHLDETPGGTKYVSDEMLEVARILSEGIEGRLEKCGLPRFRA